MTESTILKTCSKCQTPKPISEFNKSKGRTDGLTCHCKACRATYYISNRSRIVAHTKSYRDSNKEKVNAQKRTYRKTEAAKVSKQKTHHKRRALKNNCKVEDFNPSEVFKRDRYICQLCGVKTRPDFKAKHHPKRPELDHIIPLSLGGDHSRLNTQCLCHQCNIEKSNTGTGDQLRMFS